MTLDNTKRFRCKWCDGSGVVPSGDTCWSCQGTGWYENPPSASTATSGAAIAALLSVGLWWLGEPGWSVVLDGLALFFLGVAVKDIHFQAAPTALHRNFALLDGLFRPRLSAAK